MSQEPSTSPRSRAELFLKKVLARMNANREANKLLLAFPPIVNQAALSADSTTENRIQGGEKTDDLQK
jgi:hypothetical protein